MKEHVHNIRACLNYVDLYSVYALIWLIFEVKNELVVKLIDTALFYSFWI